MRSCAAAGSILALGCRGFRTDLVGCDLDPAAVIQSGGRSVKLLGAPTLRQVPARQGNGGRAFAMTFRDRKRTTGSKWTTAVLDMAGRGGARDRVQAIDA